MIFLTRAVFCVAAIGICAPAAPAQFGPYSPRARRLPRVNTGDVKLHTNSKTASVYVDGAFAGKTDKLKKFPLKPGKHKIEVREADGRTYQERVQVIRGKTVELHADPR